MPLPRPHLRLGLGLAVLLGLAACSKGPELFYTRTPGAALDPPRAFALDPRTDLVWILEGQRTLRAPDYQRAVVQALEAKGYGRADADQAALWVDVVVAVPERGRSEGKAPEGAKGGGRRGGGRGGSSGGRGAEPRPTQEWAPVSGELTLLVKVLDRTDQRVLWTGSARFPKSDAAGLSDTPEARARLLLAPFPGEKP
jgi:hypothetical protein